MHCMSNSERPAVSVIIPVYKSATYLPASLASVFDQSYTDYEIVLVDDGSPDNSRGLIADAIKRHRDRKIVYIYQENKGIAGARNTGIRESIGKYIALLDADDLWKPTRLEEGVRVLDSQPDVGLVHAGFDRIDADGSPLEPSKYEITLEHQSGHIFENLLLRRASVGALTTLFRRECCERVGVFNESRVLMGVDDRDLWVRISREYRVEFINKTLASWRVHGNNYSGNHERMVEGRLAMLDALYQQRTIGRIFYRRCASRIYKEMGDVYLIDGHFSDAQGQYLKAIRQWPLEAWAYVNGLKAILGKTRGRS